jgi:Zn-dependent metalloprotease
MSRPLPCCFIVPPKLLKKMLLDPANVAHQSGLLDTLQHSEGLRGQRALRMPGPRSLAVGEKRRTIFDGRGKANLPGTRLRSEGEAPTNDDAANAAYENAGITFDFYREVFKRNSVDGHGLRLDSTVHYRVKFNNALWNGSQMIYGDGDGVLFHDFPGALEVVAHELTHGVTQYAIPPDGLIYEGQSGALNESISDVFGVLVKQWHEKKTAHEADWTIGASVMGKGKKPLRSMSDPGAGYDPQPSTMDEFDPEGDVHANSGVPNHAFYLAATAIGGNAWEKAGKAWYRALPNVGPDATFLEFAEATLMISRSLFGDGKETKAIEDAWRKVKVIV